MSSDTQTEEQGEALVHPDILSLLRHQAIKRPKEIAFIDELGPTVTYRDLLDRVEHTALGIKSQFPSSRLYRIGMVMQNGAQMSSALLAVSSIGAALPFDPKLTAAEFDSYFGQCEITHFLTDQTDHPAAQVAEAAGIPLIDFNEIKAEHATDDTLQAPDPQATAMVLLTSGSTGRPKRVPLTHRNVCVSAANVARSLDLSPDDICLSMWELFHVGGLVDLLLAPIHSGGKIITTTGFDADRFFEILDKHQPTWAQVVPTTLHQLVQTQRTNAIARHSLRFIRSVAAELPVSLKAEAEASLSIPVVQTYGMTEASPLIASTILPPAVTKPGSVGKVCGGEVSLLDPNGLPNDEVEEGELIIRGDNVFPGYEGVSPEEHEASFVDGWYRTGDIGRIEKDGTIYLLGRSKEVINRGGEKVNMREVDEALASHPSVKEAACFPITHPTLGEDVVAAVVLNAEVETSSLLEHVSASIAAHKVPREVITLDGFPRTAIGKLDRKQLGSIYQKSKPNALKIEDGDELEQGIAAIWKRVIRSNDINLSDHFLKLGGDSLSAVRMILEVEKECGILLPENILHKLTNIESLAKEVRNARSADSQGGDGGPKTSIPEYRAIQMVMGMGLIPAIPRSPIIKGTHLDGDQAPLLWFYNSPATEMLQMSKHFDDRIPLYGGYSGGKVVDGNEEMLSKIASLYADELMEVFPQGGIHIGGNCRGARLATKVTSILLKRNYHVRSLSLLEFASKQLYDFDIPILCMFGSGSTHRAYKHVNWGSPGWERPFKKAVSLVWTAGTHGGFFRKDTISSITSKLHVFLRGDTVHEGSLSQFSSRMLLQMHSTKLGFSIYRRFYKFRAFLIFGRRKYFNPLTGEKE